MNDIECIAEVDASGLTCPLPLLKAKQQLNRINSGECIKVTATDAGSVRDFHSFADLSGHQLVAFEQTGEHYVYILKKS